MPEGSRDQLGLSFDAPALSIPRRIWSVGELVGEMRNHIEREYADVWVEGEVSNLRAAPSGHLYFTLKDGESQLPVVLFRRQATLLRFRPEDGLQALVRGKVSVYEQRGQMQLVAEFMEPLGAGSLQIAFEQLRARLQQEGLFDADRKRPLPAFPHCVGIVTSPGSAVIRDFLNIVSRRHAALQVLLYPAVVQGESAAAEVAAGIAWFNQSGRADVIVIARGGGSLEDLAPFNSEPLARAIARSELPVVCAIGHETDFTIADFVADLRAPTPSAAAELITEAQHKVEERIALLSNRLDRVARYKLIEAGQRFARLSVEATFARLGDGFGRRQQRVDELRFRADAAARAHLRQRAEHLQAATTRLLRQDASHGFRRRQASVNELRFRAEAATRAHLHRQAERLHAGTTRLFRGDASHGLGRIQQQVYQLRFHADASMRTQLRRRAEQLQAATSRLLLCDASRRLPLVRQRLSSLESRLASAQQSRFSDARARHKSGDGRLNSLSPLAVLGRGYALVFDQHGHLLKDASATAAGEMLTLRLAAGSLRSQVVDTDQGNKPAQRKTENKPRHEKAFWNGRHPGSGR